MTVHLTRRDFTLGVSAFAAFAVAGGFDMPAFADTVPVSDLMAADALPDQVLGKADAPVTIVEYASMTCSHCAHFTTTTFPKIKEQYIDTGKVRFILREFPLDPLAAAAFLLARCAGPDKYYPLVETLFSQQDKWAVQKPLEPLFAIVRQAGFTQQSFNSCLDTRGNEESKKILSGIESVRARGADKFKVDSTPTFFINGERFKGALSFDEMEKAISTYLKV